MRFHGYPTSLAGLNTFHLIITYATSDHTHVTHNSNSHTTWERSDQNLNIYASAVDGTCWDPSPEVFSQNVTANYTGPASNITSLPALQSVLTTYVSSRITQHQLGTTVTHISDD